MSTLAHILLPVYGKKEPSNIMDSIHFVLGTWQLQWNYRTESWAQAS